MKATFAFPWQVEHTMHLGSNRLRLALIAATALWAGSAFGADPKERLPKGATLRLGSVNLQHEAAVTQVVFSADGKKLFSAGKERPLRVWDPATGKQTATLTDHAGGVAAIASTAHGLVISNGSVVYFFAPDGKWRWQKTPSKHGARCLAISPDGKTIAAGDSNNFIYLLSAKDGRTQHTFEAHQGWVSSVTFTPDSKQLISGGQDFKVGVWDVASGKNVHTIADHGEWVWGVAVAPHGRWFASASWDNTIGIWDRAATSIRRLKGHTGRVWCVAVSPDGNTIASGGDDNTLRFWNAESGKLLHTIAHPWWVNDIAFAPDSATVATAGEDNLVRLFDVKTGKQLIRRDGHQGAVVAVAALGKDIVTAGKDGTLRVWDAAGKSRVLKDFTEPLTALAVKKNWLAVGTKSGLVFVIENAAVDKAVKIQAHRDVVSGLAFTADDQLVTASYDGTLSLWLPEDGRKLKYLESNYGHRGWVTCLASHPIKNVLASGGSDKIVVFWDAEQGRGRGFSKEHKSWISGVAFSPTGDLVASIGLDEAGKIYDDMKLLHTLDPRQKNPNDNTQVDMYAVAFSPDGKTLAIAGEDRTIRLWDVKTGTIRQTLPGQLAAIRALTYLADGTLVSGSDDGTTLLWNVK